MFEYVVADLEFNLIGLKEAHLICKAYLWFLQRYAEGLSSAD